jgi:hypothetical protein
MTSTRTLARTAGSLYLVVAVCVAIQCLNLLNQFAALSIATGGDVTNALGRAGSDALVMLFADMQRNGFLIAQMFFGLWLLPLGYLVVRSRYVPKVLGVLLIIGCFSYLADLFTRFLAPDLGADITSFLAVPAAVGELSFVAWLLVKTVKVPEKEARVPATV